MEWVNEDSTFEEVERGNELLKEAWTLLVKAEDIIGRFKFSNDGIVTTVHECQMQDIVKSLRVIQTDLEHCHTSEDKFNEIKAKAVQDAKWAKEFDELCDSMEREDD